MPRPNAADTRAPKHSRLSAAVGVYWGAGIAALVYACWCAARHRWVCDDAFISFRYAENLFRGLGLVFNEGERVEGYSNFLWTIYTTIGLRLGAAAETWATWGSILCYLGSLGLLAWNGWVVRRDSPGLLTFVPVAAVLGALHPDWQIFATGGLETALFALEVTAVYVVSTSGEIGGTRAAVAGSLLALISMTRPEGSILTVPLALFVFLAAPARTRAVLILLAAFAILWVPYTIWRVSYYGDFFPNTYYAKSAAIAWYSQGATYIALYFARYWPLALGPVFILIAWLRNAPDGGGMWRAAEDPWCRRAILAALLALVYMGFVLRVGGDFMFARFLIPVTPLLLVLAELGITRVAAGRMRVQAILAGLAATGLLLTPYPLPRDPLGDVRGIVFEPNFYTKEATDTARHYGLALRPFFDGLPVRVAFYGGEARLVYYARPRVAIECVTGLTDRHVARQPLKERGRIGHEKLASLDYVLGTRRAHFTFFPAASSELRLDREIPQVTIEMGGLQGLVLTWDPALMDSLRRRGAVMTDFPAELDRILMDPDLLRETLNQDWFTYEKLDRFYFAQARDPARLELFQRRMREAGRRS